MRGSDGDYACAETRGKEMNDIAMYVMDFAIIAVSIGLVILSCSLAALSERLENLEKHISPNDALSD